MPKYRRITRSDRYQIEKYLSRKKSIQKIADELGFHRSTIYREVNRGKIIYGAPGGKKRGKLFSLRGAQKVEMYI